MCARLTDEENPITYKNAKLYTYFQIKRKSLHFLSVLKLPEYLTFIFPEFF